MRRFTTTPTWHTACPTDEAHGTVQVVNFNGTDVPLIKADTIEEKASPSPGEP
jgi:hypothetical protein